MVPKVGSLVLIQREESNRLKWPLRVVIKEYLGKDGSYSHLPSKLPKVFLTRPIQRLVNLELPQSTQNSKLSLKNDSPSHFSYGRLIKKSDRLTL